MESYSRSETAEEENRLANLLNISLGFNAAAVALQGSNNLNIEALLKSNSGDSAESPQEKAIQQSDSSSSLAAYLLQFN